MERDREKKQNESKGVKLSLHVATVLTVDNYIKQSLYGYLGQSPIPGKTPFSNHQLTREKNSRPQFLGNRLCWAALSARPPDPFSTITMI